MSGSTSDRKAMYICIVKFQDFVFLLYIGIMLDILREMLNVSLMLKH